MSKRISRRTVLRGFVGGTAVGLSLPLLEAMLAPGSAAADSEMAKPIFGVFFWANGYPWNEAHGEAYDDVWTPVDTGVGYTPSEMLQPLEGHSVSVVSGLAPQTNVQLNPSGNDGHQRGFMAALTSDIVHPEGFSFAQLTLTANRESIDQYVAKHDDFYGNDVPPFRSLVLGVSDARFRLHSHWNGISYNGPFSQNSTIGDPTQLNNLLFGVPDDPALLERRASLLDAVMEDASQLKVQLGAGDQQRVDAHLEHLYEVQRRLEMSGSCEGPSGPPEAPTELDKKTRVMAELLALALECDLTRVFSFMLTSPATTHVFSNLLVDNDMHNVCHFGEWDNVHAITRYQMDCFSIFLETMAAGSGIADSSPLDRATIFATSEYSDGKNHYDNEMPVLFAGGGCGALAQGIHVRDAGGNLAKAHLTAFRALGLPTQSYGFTGSQTSSVIGELLV